MSETTAVGTEAEVNAEETRPSPGSIIRRTRERAGLSLEELAAQMKLAKSTLDALERDDFVQLREPVYVRGYYRKCAKVLPIAEQELISAYEAMAHPAAPSTPDRIVLAGGVTSGVRKGHGKTGIVVVLVAAAALGFLVWNADRGLPRLTSRSVTPPAVNVPPPEPVTEQTLPPDAALPAPDTTAPPSAGTADTVPPPAATTPAPAGPRTGAGAPSGAVPAPATGTPAAGSTPPAAVAANQLILTFNEASWVRVEDSRNRTLSIGLIRAGERQVLNGEPPYAVFLGHAAGVDVEFGGRNVDVSPHLRENGTARFTLP